MTVVKVNRIHPKSLKTLLTSSPDILGIRPKSMPSIRLALERKLGGQENLVAFARSLHPFTDNVLAFSVNISHVPETQSCGMCVFQKGHFVVEGTGWAIESAEASETETDSSDLGAISAQGSQGKRHY